MNQPGEDFKSLIVNGFPSWLMETIDLDHSGKLDVDEFVSFLKGLWEVGAFPKIPISPKYPGTVIPWFLVTVRVLRSDGRYRIRVFCGATSELVRF